MLPGSTLESLDCYFDELEERASADFSAEKLQGCAELSVDIRYRAQGYELNVAYERTNPLNSAEAFHLLHQKRYGFCDRAKSLDIVNLRLRMVAAAKEYEPEYIDPVRGDSSPALFGTKEIFFGSRFIASNLYRRDCLVPGDIVHGPAMITEYTSATVLPPGCRAQVDGFGNLLIDVAREFE
jgi:N-methylhydantoinase A